MPPQLRPPPQVSMLRLCLLAAAFVAFSAPRVSAQAPSGSIRGRVVDDAGAPIVGARVALLGTARSAYTGADGAFSFTGLTARDYRLRAQRLGFLLAAVD